MTSAGQAQAAAAKAIAPALTEFSQSLARTRKAGPAEHALIASRLHGCLGTLASTVNQTGYAAANHWHLTFPDGAAAKRDWLQATTRNAAELIHAGSSLTLPIRAASKNDPALTLPAARAAQAAWKACLHLGKLITAHNKARTPPQVPDYAAILSALHASCTPLATALTALAPRLAGIDPDPFDIWCEGFAGDLTAAYRDAARHCEAAGSALHPAAEQTTAGIRTWRSRHKTRRAPARVPGPPYRPETATAAADLPAHSRARLNAERQLKKRQVPPPPDRNHRAEPQEPAR